MSGNSIAASKETLLALCNEALQGVLSVKSLCDRWPDHVNRSEFSRILHDDLEEAVEHFPAHWLTGTPNINEWKRSQMFVKLWLDRALLSLEADRK
jgi:hypothetical protein